SKQFCCNPPAGHCGRSPRHCAMPLCARENKSTTRLCCWCVEATLIRDRTAWQIRLGADEFCTKFHPFLMQFSSWFGYKSAGRDSAQTNHQVWLEGGFSSWVFFRLWFSLRVFSTLPTC